MSPLFAKCLQDLDVDGDGVIDLAEFMVMMISVTDKVGMASHPVHWEDQC